MGHPNVGKSVVFGALTGTYVTVSNYPGTTVEITRGRAHLGGQLWEVIDTPGTHNLVPMSEDEAVTRDINLQFTNLNPALKDKVLLPRLGTAINLKEMNHTIELMQKYGLLKTPVDLSKRVFTP